MDSLPKGKKALKPRKRRTTEADFCGEFREELAPFGTQMKALAPAQQRAGLNRTASIVDNSLQTQKKPGLHRATSIAERILSMPQLESRKARRSAEHPVAQAGSAGRLQAAHRAGGDAEAENPDSPEGQQALQTAAEDAEAGPGSADVQQVLQTPADDARSLDSNSGSGGRPAVSENSEEAWRHVTAEAQSVQPSRTETLHAPQPLRTETLQVDEAGSHGVMADVTSPAANSVQPQPSSGNDVADVGNMAEHGQRRASRGDGNAGVSKPAAEPQQPQARWDDDTADVSNVAENGQREASSGHGNADAGKSANSKQYGASSDDIIVDVSEASEQEQPEQGAPEVRGISPSYGMRRSLRGIIAAEALISPVKGRSRKGRQSVQHQDAACAISFESAGNVCQKSAACKASSAYPQAAAQEAAKNEQMRKASDAIKAKKAEGERCYAMLLASVMLMSLPALKSAMIACSEPVQQWSIHSFMTHFPIQRSGALQQTLYGTPPICHGLCLPVP